MKLNEVEPRSIINVTVSKENASINLTTTSVEFNWDVEALLVEPFMYEEAIVSFDIEDINVEMMVVKEGEVPFYWKHVTVSKVRKEGKLYHAIITDLAGARLNRRNSFRVFVGEEGSAFQVPGGETLSVLIKDISATGIGFIIKNAKEPYYKPGNQVHIHYSDNEARFGIDVVGRVVRAEMVETGYLYGCSFSKVYPQISKYVAQKQVKNRKKKRMEKLTGKLP